MLKAVLGSLAIFTLSFYKDPKKIVKEITKIQNNFLWGGSEGKKCIHWVRWDVVCIPIEKGGLDVRRIEDFNLALLCKWRWRIFHNKETLWYGVLKVRHRDININLMHCGMKGKGLVSSSVLWDDLMKLDGKHYAKLYSVGCEIIVGNGFSVSFWHAKWTIFGCLKLLFAVLFLVSMLQDSSTALMGG